MKHEGRISCSFYANKWEQMEFEKRWNGEMQNACVTNAECISR